MSTKVKSARSRVFRLLKKAPMIIGCVIFLSSVFFPYLRFFHYWEYSADVWSFKVAFHHYALDYFGHYMGFDSIPFPELPWINIMMLIAQILVLATGIASLFVSKKVLAFASLAFCFIVIMLIQHVGIRIGGSFFQTEYYFTHQTGYYLTLSSLPFYLIAFTVELASSRRRKRMQDTNSTVTLNTR